jgi:Domain of unknown function (DUF1906)/FG-GAP-like repeat
VIRRHLFTRPSSRALVVGAAVVLLAAGLAGPAAADPSPGPHDPRASLPSGHVAPPPAGPAVARQIAAATLAVAPGTFTGKGFDACTAPSSGQMQAWLTGSPYRAVGIYFGGANRACPQPQLTPTWVAQQQAVGWHLMPLYLGLQAPCTTSSKPYLIDPLAPAAEGRAQAEDAALQADTLGLGRDSALIFDMEAYDPNDSACTAVVTTFIDSWTRRLHELGYLSGFYSSMNSGVRDQVGAYSGVNYAHPDYLDFAKWDGVATVNDAAIPGTYWAPYRRIKQYQGDHNETYGGVTINIDNDYLYVGMPPTTPFGDRNGSGWSDVLALESATGNLYLYPGNGTGLGNRTQVGGGLSGMNTLARHGDFTGDGYEDLWTREASTGYLWRYPGTATGGLGTRTRHGAGWNTMREITAIGDLTGDGRNDLVAIETSTGRMYRYTGPDLTSRVALGSGWNTMDELVGIGDFNRDGRTDVIAREKSTGYLYLYPGSGGTFPTRTRISAINWTGLRDISAVGDFNRDGYVDMVAVLTSTGRLYRYLGNGSGFASGIGVSSGWSGLAPVL